MDDYGIKPEWQQAFEYTERFTGKLCKENDLRNLSLHLLAKLMESEFMREHTHCRAQQIVMFNPDRTFIEWYNGNESCHDPRHNYDDAAWLEAARKYLSERRDDEQSQIERG